MPTTAVTASLAAAYLAQEALYLVHSNGGREKEGLHFGEKITVSLQPYETRTYGLPRNPECLAHESFEDIRVRKERPRDVTVMDVLEWADGPSAVVELGFDLITEMVCAGCGQREPMLQPLDSSAQALLHCSRCLQESRHPETISWLDADHPLSRMALAELHIPDHGVVCVKEAEARTYYQLGGRPMWPQPGNQVDLTINHQP
jgi:hypothetical protein